MEKPRKSRSPTAYVKQVAEETRQCLLELKGENEQLRTLVAALRTESQRLVSFTGAAAEPQAQATLKLRAELAAREEEMASLKRALESHQRRHADLEGQLVGIERDNLRYTERFVSLERRASRLWSLYVASYRLHETLERQQVLQVIEEIVNAIIGSEELAVFERGPEAKTLRLVVASGVEAGPLKEIAVGRGLIGGALASGEMYVAGKELSEKALPFEEGLTACIPLKLGEKVTGGIAIFRLLPQKPVLETTDHELFELLGTQAAMALYCTQLHAAQASA